LDIKSGEKENNCWPGARPIYTSVMQIMVTLHDTHFKCWCCSNFVKARTRFMIDYLVKATKKFFLPVSVIHFDAQIMDA